jgi:hypothetical protein
MRLRLLTRSIPPQILLLALAILGIMPDPYDLTSFRGLTLLWSDSSTPNPADDLNDSSDQVCGSVRRGVNSDPRMLKDGSPGFRLTPMVSWLASLAAHKARIACHKKETASVKNRLRVLCQLTC